VFSIEFSALHYTDPARNAYAYRLIGFDRDWVYADATPQRHLHQSRPGQLHLRSQGRQPPGRVERSATS
jgi:hypothetical protein